jgi:Tfp pilus assembly protein PilN
MRAVNLIPADERRGPAAAGKSGGGVYVLLAALALVVACVAALTITNRQVSERTAEADRLESQAQVAQAKAGNLAAYKQFNDLVKQRTTGVQALAATRVDWAEKLDQVSRVVPSDVSLTQLVASTAPGVGVGGGVVSLRTALTNPAIELIGCAPTQSRVALLMARLRRLEGVQRVSVANSAKADGSTAASAGEDSAGGGCQTTDQIPKFQMVVFFGTPQAAATTTAPSGKKAAIDTLNGGTSGTTTTPAPAASGS